MDIFTAIKGRRSFRNYLSTPVEEEKLKAILEAGRWAPSVMNLQPWNFLVVKNQDIKTRLKASCQETLDKIYAASGWKWVSRFKLDFLTEAPVIIVVAGDPKKNRRRSIPAGKGNRLCLLLLRGHSKHAFSRSCTGSGQLMVYSFRNR